MKIIDRINHCDIINMFNPFGRLPLWRRPFVMSDIIIGNCYCQQENEKNFQKMKTRSEKMKRKQMKTQG